ncbi:hypothetical protein RND71_036332 [Anisodus tanguticus]|uniref:Disease resistance protein RPS4B/Roq1-like leucine-rich repeats domain-containing protein n=1 Tax=Anisodus tanguticus TaxID=243964 RepID=A0AAE1USN3_9SOLA|nr:hypothetical protein RND71_036332 [Anisodus tanguticus]
MAKLGSQRHARNAENLVGMESHMQKLYKMLQVGYGGGTENIEGISLKVTNTEEVNVIRTAFMQMTRLRFLKLEKAYICQGPDFLPGELRWLDWHRYPSKSLPIGFQGELLVGLKLKNSRIIQLWKGSKVLWNLKYINLSHSQKLIGTPDFSGTPNLERLVLEECTSLVEIKFSVTDLGKLVLLNLKNCRNLKTLPKSIQLESLEVLILSGCLKLKTFPDIKEKMNRLSELYLEATALRELPASVENLSGVSLINLSYCKNLENLPSNICRLKCLRTLALSGCSRLEKLSDDVGLLVVLEELHCDGTAIERIPSSISLLKNLKHLSFRGCNALSLQVGSSIFSSWFSGKGQNSMGLTISNLSSLCSLTTLDISHCNISDGGTLCILGCLSSLVELNLSGNNFNNIPAASISGLTRLICLELVGCRLLVNIPELPQCIEEVHVDECTSLESIDQLVKYPMLRRVYSGQCSYHAADDSIDERLLKINNQALTASIRPMTRSKKKELQDKLIALMDQAQDISVNSIFAALDQRFPSGLRIKPRGNIFQ